MITCIQIKSYNYPVIVNECDVNFTLHPASEQEPLERAVLLLQDDQKILLIHDNKNVVYGINDVNLVPNL